MNKLKRLVALALTLTLALSAFCVSASAKTNPAGQTVGTVLFYVRNSAGEDILVSQIPVSEMEEDMEAGEIDTTNHNYSLLDRYVTTVHQEAQGFTVPEFITYAQSKSTVDSLKNLDLTFAGEDEIAFWEIDQTAFDEMDTYSYNDLYGVARYNFPLLYEYWNYRTQDYYDPAGVMTRDEVIDYIFENGEPETFLLSVRAFSQRYMITDEKYGTGDYNMENLWQSMDVLDNERTVRMMLPMTEADLRNKTSTASNSRYWVANILLDMEKEPDVASLGSVAAPTAVMTEDEDTYYITFDCATPGATILYNHNYISPSYTPSCEYTGGTVEIPKSWFPGGTVTMTCRAVKDGYTDAGVQTLTLTASGTAAADAWDGTTIDVSWYNTSDTKFYISTPEQLMGLAAIVNGIYNKEITNIIGDASCIVDSVAEGDGEGAGNNLSTATYHYGADDFNGKTIYLTADLNMGGVYDPVTQTWSGPRYMPIGGQYLMEKNDSLTKLSSSFCGTLDGQGHYIANIYCDRHCSNGNYGDGQSVGLIGRLGVHDSDPVEIRPEAPAVRNLAVTGYVYANRSVGGIVGKIGKTVDGAVIENCANFATVSNTDAKGCGGIVGASWNGGVIRNCYNAGKVSTTYVCPTGGISGSNEIAIENCYNVGTILAIRDSYAMAIGTNNGGGVYVDNCYWLTGSAPGGGYYGATRGTVTELSAAEMKAAASKLGSAFTADTGNINGGYPVLTWQVGTVIPAPGTPPEKISFTDVADSAWYAEAVDFVVARGLFNGTGDGMFTPDGTMTRAMFATVLHRYMGTPAPTGAAPFTDVPAGTWYTDAVAWAAEQGYMNGTGNNEFSPNIDIPLEQMLTVLYRCAGSPAAETAVPTKYGPVSSWAEDAVSWANGTGLLNGVGGALTAKGAATRAQVAGILMNFTN